MKRLVRSVLFRSGNKMAQIVKSGYVKRYSKSLLSGGWQKCWIVLHQDSNLVIYKKSGDTDPKGSVFLKDVCKRFAYGQYTNGMPDQPNLPGGATVDQLLAIPARNNSNAKIHWLLTNSAQELNEWMAAICSVLPPPGSSHSSSHTQQPIQATQAAPPAYSAPPGGGLGFAGVAGPPPAYPQAPAGYPQQPYPTQQAYPQQQYYPPPAYPQQPHPQQAYPQQGYPQQAYPQQGYAPPPGYAPAPAQYAQYPQGQHGYYQQPQQVVYAKQKKSGGGMLGGNAGKMAAGLIGGAALGYGASRMMGGFGGFGLGHHGSWSSLSSFGSCGSFGSFGS
ncbi:hypothetical protein ScPMuIL_001593 [Solemya velum]